MDRKAHDANASYVYEGRNSPRYDRRHRSSGRADALTSRPIPFGTGLVASFDRPGGNLTGFFMDQSSLAGKWIGLLILADKILKGEKPAIFPSSDRASLSW